MIMKKSVLIKRSDRLLNLILVDFWKKNEIIVSNIFFWNYDPLYEEKNDRVWF